MALAIALDMNTMKTHLKILGQDPFADPTRDDVRWNEDYSAYRVSSLRWFDDASYARYQASDLDD